MARLDFPPLNKRFLSNNETIDTVLLNARAKTDDKVDKLMPSIQEGKTVLKLVDKKRGLYNPTDFKRPAGITPNVAQRSKYLFTEVKDDTMNIFGNTISEQGITRLAKLMGNVEVPDMTDSAWLSEREKIVAQQTALGKTPKQIDDYLLVNRPLNRDQNKVRRNEAVGQSILNKDQQIITITDAVAKGVAATLTGQVSITEEVIKLLGKYGGVMDRVETENIANSIKVIRPGLTWKDSPINRRFLIGDDFDIIVNGKPNDKVGFYLALILQTYMNKPLGPQNIAEVSAAAVAAGVASGSALNSTISIIKTMKSPGIPLMFDLENNSIILEDEAKKSAEVNGSFDPVLWNYLAGSTTITQNMKTIDEAFKILKQRAKVQRSDNILKINTGINDDIRQLTGNFTGLSKTDIEANISQFKKDFDKNAQDIKDSSAIKGVKKQKAALNKLVAQRTSISAKMTRFEDDLTDLKARAADLELRRVKLVDDERDAYNAYIAQEKAKSDSQKKLLIRVI